MTRKDTYLLFCVLGGVLPYTQFIPWFRENGLNAGFFVRQLFANGVSGAFGFDVLISSIVLVGFIRVEGKKLGMRRLWLPILGLLAMGVSFALPFFLYLRERALEAREAPTKS
jgi:hypothetical protein